MNKAELITRYNTESADKAMLFNSLPADKQLALARDPLFWRHRCARYSFRGICVACGSRTAEAHRPALIPRRSL